MVKNPPVNAEGTGSIPEPGRSHMSRSDCAYVPQLLSLYSRAQELKLLKPTPPRAHGPQQGKPLQGKACALQLESSQRLPVRESPHSKEPSATRSKRIIKTTTYLLILDTPHSVQNLPQPGIRPVPLQWRWKVESKPLDHPGGSPLPFYFYS